MANEGCKYCNNLRITHGDEFNIALMDSHELKVLGNNISLSVDISGNRLCLNGFNADDIITEKINFCPMCGRRL